MTERLNESFIKVMEKLSNIMLKRGEPFRARAYQKAKDTIQNFPQDILNLEVLKGKPNIGPTVMEKLNEYVKTGTLEIIESEKNNPVNILSDVYGIGPVKAKELVEKHGIQSIEQLRTKQYLLNEVQKIGLQFYEDVLKRIPRKEIDEYNTLLETLFSKDKNITFKIVGSYRRGADESGDIDVIVTASEESFFVKFIDVLIQEKIIVSILSRGTRKCLVMAKIANSDTVRRVDFLYAPVNEFPFAILYFTGSKEFNTMMRNRALQMNLTMNEHGIYYLKDKKKGEKVVDRQFNTEKDIFDFLNLEYKAPEERNLNPSTTSIDTTLAQPFQKVANLAQPSTTTINTNLVQPFQKVAKVAKVAKLIHANNMYHNDTQIMTDSEYDALYASVSKEFPDHPALKQIGAPVITKNKVTLPYFMGSMNKIKPDTNALFNWKKRYTGPYVLSCKLDGVSSLYTTEYGTPKLYTRGDGKVGQDISYLIPYLRLPNVSNITIRGELIISKASFEEKYKMQQANPRNMVAGIVNQKKINCDVLKDVEFVAYELITPSCKKPSEQMNILSKMDVKVVQHALFESSCTTNEKLSEVLIECRKTSPYSIDGIIVAHDGPYAERKEGNPEHAFAFKMVLTEQIAEASVIDVVWTPSKDGYMKPRVQIEPVQLGGVCIEYATGFNGAFIEKNRIGFGAVIELVRSGDVIPHIRRIVVPAGQPKMPDVPYKWNDTHVDLIIENMDTDLTVREKNITRFFKGLQVDGIGPGNVNRMIHAGFDTIPKIVNMKEDDLLKVEGFQTKTAQKLSNNIKSKLQSATLVTVMAASNLFGRGFNEKKMELILNEYPDVVTDDSLNQEEKIEKVKGVKGMSEKTAESFVRVIPEFKEFIKNIGMEDKLNISQIKKSDEEEKEEDKPNHPLFNKSVVFTGFRDQTLENNLKSIGAKIATSVSKNTFVVLVKDKTQQNENSGKILDAKKWNIQIMTPNEVTIKYLMKHI